MSNYEISNATETIREFNRLSAKSKKLFQNMREQKGCTQTILQIVTDNICEDLNIETIQISFSGKQPSSGRGKILGVYRQIGTGLNGKGRIEKRNIKVYQYTAKQLKQVATKTAFNTLLHELCHYFDYRILYLNNSVHTAGFYKRISALKDTLMK